MHRRDFLKKSIAAGAALSLIPGYELLSAQPEYDLVALKGGGPVEMFEKGIAELGGMKKFVKKGQTVVVKPNIGWDVEPERAANTNPLLIGAIIEHCYAAGAKKVYVFDHTCDNWNKCYSNSGIERAAKDAGAQVVSGASESYYQDVEVKKGKSLKSTQVHELILESDVFINAPVLKHHSSGKLTMGMKNLMGIVWDRRYWHRNDLHQCIADFSSFRKPDLNIVDAYRVMKRNGPRGVSKEDILTMKSQLISTDIVAIDSAGAKLFGYEPENIQYIKAAHDMRIGTMDLKNLSIRRIKM